MTPQQRQVLAAAMDRILPSENTAGAVDAHTIGYAEWVVQQDEFRSAEHCFASGLALLDSLAISMWGKYFPACTATERDAVLGQVEGVPHRTIQRFFSMLVRITLAGFLCAPSYGGNRNRVGWSYIGFVPHPLTSGSAAVEVEA
jgi:hypothetical protein